MAASTFLVIGMVGLVLLAIAALMGADDMDVDADLDADLDVDVDADTDLHAHADPSGSGVGGTVLEWLSLKGLAVGAVGFGFVGWATTSNGSSALVVWLLSIAAGMALWALAVKLLFPLLRRQQGHDLQRAESYNGLMAEVVVRIPPNGVGIVQFTDPNGLVLRRDARSRQHEQEIRAGEQVVVLLSTSEHVVVDEFLYLEET